MRQDYAEFTRRGAEILILGPDGPNAFRRYWEAEQMPFTGLPDLRNQVAGLYFQDFSLLKLGWMPAQFVVDGDGMVRYAHYGKSMQDIPKNAEILKVLDEIQTEIE